MNHEDTLVEIDGLLRLIVRERIDSQRWLYEDALQEARIRAWQRLDQGHSIGIAVHAAKQAVIDVCLGKRMTGSKQAGVPITRTVPLTLEGPSGDEFTVEPADPTAEDDFAAVEEDADALLVTLLAPLSEAQRSAVLGSIEGLTRDEIASRDGVTPQAVSYRLKTAREKLAHLAS